MKTALIATLVMALLLTPCNAFAQRGHGGGGGGGQHGPPARMAAGHPGGGHPQFGHPGAQAYYNHRAPYHGGWYHGSWNGGWAHPYAYRPWGWYGGGVGWGLGVGFGTGLAVGAVTFGSPWGWGYYPYYNPYWGGPAYGATYINYGQPLVVNAQPAPAPAPSPVGVPGAVPAPAPSDAARPSPNQERALALFESARGYFKRGDYPMALAETNKAVALLPNDSLMHEFRGLCLFATRDYQSSAAAVYAVLSIGPGWDFATVQGLYPNQNVYNDQLRMLEAYRSTHPEAPNAHFLLAYHYLLANRNDQAAIELQTVVKLEPKDQLSGQLLKGITTRPEDQQAAPALEAPAAEPVGAESLVGNWRANRSDGAAFELDLTADNHFAWRFSQQDKQQQLRGTYTVANNFLILSASGQNALIGQVALEPGDKLKFKLAGGSAADPGLTFTR